MKKILIILSIFLIILTISKNDNKTIVASFPNNLSGNKINDNLYYYQLVNDEANLISYTYIDNNLYYLKKIANVYYLVKRNIYENQETIIKQFNDYDYCQFQNNFVVCFYETSINYYNLNGELVYQIDNKDKTIYVIPYKDTFLKLDNLALYLNQNKEDILFQRINLINVTYLDYFSNLDNTYLLFQDLDTKSYYLYSINTRDYQVINALDYYIYEAGFYFKNENNYLVFNLVNNTNNEYSNFLNEDYSLTTFDSDNNLYGYKENSLKILSLKNQTYQELSILDITSLKVFNKYLFLTTRSGVYLLSLDNINLKTQDLLSYQQMENQNINNIIQTIKKDYLVNIYTKEETLLDYPDFYVTIASDNKQIKQALFQIQEVLNKFDITFFNSFYNQNYEGLNIYLTGPLSPQDYSNQAANPLAYSLILDKKYTIVMDITYENLQTVLCHELMHNLESNITKGGTLFLSDWSSYNPSNFNYTNNYAIKSLDDYTLNEPDKANVYFVDSYAHTFVEEDHARIFELLCTANNNLLDNYPKLQAKANYLQQEILKYYPTLEYASLFN